MILFPIVKETFRGMETDTFFADSKIKTIGINELLNISSLDLIICVHFNLVYPCIIEMLLNNNYHSRSEKDDKTQSFDFGGKYLSIYKDKKNRIDIIDYSSKFLQDFIDFETAHELEKSDISKKFTPTQDGMFLLQKTISSAKNEFARKKIFDKIFPELKDEEYNYNKEAKKMVSAVMFYQIGEYKNIYAYDIKSSFPARIYQKNMPAGAGTFFDDLEQIPKNRWYIKRIRVYVAKEKNRDYLGISELEKPCMLYVTPETEQILKDYYVSDYEFIDGYYYKLQKSIFDNFFDMNFAEEKNKAIKKYNKAKCNTVIGAFGKNDIFNMYMFNLKGERLTYSTVQTETEHKAYYPIYLCVNGRAKLEFIKILEFVGKENIIYANTDGFFCKKSIDFSIINSEYCSKIGKVEFRGMYDKLCIKCISNYCGVMNGSDDYRLSGRVPTKKITYDDFYNGFNSAQPYLTGYGFVDFYINDEQSFNEVKEVEKLKKELEHIERIRGFYITSERGRVIKQEEERLKAEQLKELISLAKERRKQRELQDFCKKYELKLLKADDLINEIF